VRLRKLWIWSAEEAQFYKAFISGTCLHVCCGSSEIGDVRVDIEPRPYFVATGQHKMFPNVDVVCDYRYLPFADRSFDTALCDPPWGKARRLIRA